MSDFFRNLKATYDSANSIHEQYMAKHGKGAHAQQPQHRQESESPRPRPRNRYELADPHSWAPPPKHQGYTSSNSSDSRINTQDQYGRRHDYRPEEQQSHVNDGHRPSRFDNGPASAQYNPSEGARPRPSPPMLPPRHGNTLGNAEKSSERIQSEKVQTQPAPSGRPGPTLPPRHTGPVAGQSAAPEMPPRHNAPDGLSSSSDPSHPALPPRHHDGVNSTGIPDYPPPSYSPSDPSI